MEASPRIAPDPAPPAWREVLAIARHHIVLIAMAATVTFGWVLTGRRFWVVALLCGLDWFVINVVNRVTDIAEDLRNAIPGTERVARFQGAIAAGSTIAFAASLVASHLAWPALTPWRVAVQVIGVAYNFRVIPWLRRDAEGALRAVRTRFKEMYFFKNFMSAVLFVLTCFAYPLAVDGAPLAGRWATIASLALFFVPFELTYEILYDLRDLEGDRAEGVPTYPVVHGPAVAERIIKVLLVLACAVLLAGFFTRAVGVRELLMLAAPLLQVFFYRPRLARGLTTRDCIVLTHLGTAELALFLIGTAIWSAAGLPANILL